MTTSGPADPSTATLDALVADLRELVECESPSDDHAAIERSADLVAWLGARRLGIAPERIVLDGVHHLRWRFGGPRVLVLAHHDTVWPIGTLTRHPFSVTDGILRGPGCFDMLAGLAMALHAIAGLADRTGVTLLVTGDEELGAGTSRGLIEDEARQASAALVLEASAEAGALKTARKGTSHYEIDIVGRAAHAGLEPEKGVNAAVEQAHQILAIAGLDAPAAGTTVTPTAARAGTTRNTVPASARFSVDVRAWTSEEQDRVDTAIRALRPVLPDARIQVNGGINRPPLPESASLPLYERARKIAGRLGLPELTHAAVGGGSDGNFTAGVGTQTLDGLGAVGGGAHAEHEHVLVDRLVDRTVLLRGLLEELLGDEVR
ncbi:M20 family metallopeptidase [Nocardia alni]|uniref:M20 family metallopeptidase n=1 Tax=Nocardia alni TaxID=2815723 RepID=UPI0020B38170|nr:M20 family metallopeptidase [Nocardia alni]